MNQFLVVLCVFVTTIQGKHFRGSMITWRVLNSTSTTVLVELLQRHAWHWNWYPCNDTEIVAGNYMIGSGDLMCSNPCPPGISSILTSVAVPCTAYNIPELFTIGERRTRINIPINSLFTATFSGGKWFVLAQGGGNWSVAVQINTYRRTNGQFNQAPVVTMLPIIRLRRNLTYNIRINVADNDFDPYQCLWSKLHYECSGVCMTVPNTTVLNSTSCILTFTPPKLGYYAIALTVVDYETVTSTNELSRVPIQFLFKIWDSNDTCSLPPIYLGDVPPDQCIYIESGQIRTMRIVIKIQCPNATLDNIIGVYPVGFTQSPTYRDPYDPSVNLFMISYTARAEQMGQNLFCFAGVDSIGNQADTTCLRFTVQQGISSMNTLYLLNATRFPIGSVSKSRSIWTLIYPNGSTYSRPTMEASIRFKYASSKVDFLVINVATAINVDYQSNRLIITTSTTSTPGTSFYISFDPGVFLAISTCLKDSMGIMDPYFWTFSIPSERSTTATTSPTTTTTQSTILRSRTSPILRTINLTSISSIFVVTTPSTVVNTWKNPSTTTQHIPTMKKNFPISDIVGILLGSLLLIVLIIKIRYLFLKIEEICMKRYSKIGRLSVRQSLTQGINHYRVTARMNRHKSRKYTLTTIDENDESVEEIDMNNDDTQDSVITKHQLVEIECELLFIDDNTQ